MVSPTSHQNPALPPARQTSAMSNNLMQTAPYGNYEDYMVSPASHQNPSLNPALPARQTAPDYEVLKVQHNSAYELPSIVPSDYQNSNDLTPQPPIDVKNENQPTNELAIYEYSDLVSPPRIPSSNRCPPPPALPRDTNGIEQPQSPNIPPLVLYDN